MPQKDDAQSLVAALQKVHDALAPLESEQRKRVISSALSLLGMDHEIPTGASASVSAGSERIEESRRLDSTSTSRPISIIEVIQEKLPATNPQRLAVFAYYREKYEGISRFSRSDLKGYFARAKEPPPQNFDRDFGTTVKQGWIHEDGNESYLTSKGLEAVEAGFAGKAQPRGIAVAKPKSRKQKRISKKKR